MSGKLYVVATPIGNLEDITLRAIRILKEADLILCEDTRITRKLLYHYNIQKPLYPYYQHSGPKTVKRILEDMDRGANLALVVSAGTPGVSDPGPRLIQDVIERFGDEVSIIPVPGPSAVTAIASIAGVSMNEFHFFGYPPSKKGRRKFFQRVVANPYPGIIFESPHRINKTLEDLQQLVDERQIVVARELTKVFETVHRGTLGDLRKTIGAQKPRGEYVILVESKKSSHKIV